MRVRGRQAFGFWSRNQHPFIHRQIEKPKGRLPYRVGKGRARRPAPRCAPNELHRGLVDQRHGVERGPKARPIEDRGHQVPSFGTGGGEVIRCERAGHLTNESPERDRSHGDGRESWHSHWFHRHVASLLSFSSRSASLSASSKRPMSPSITEGKSCNVMLMRWSVTRLCG